MKTRNKGLINNVLVDLDGDRFEMIYGGWENKRIKSLLLNTADKKFLDIGAEQGDISALVGIVAEETALIEPSPLMWGHIKKNFERNNISLKHYFVGFASDTTQLNPKGLNYNDTYRDGYPECAFNELDYTRGFRHLHEEASATKQIRIDDFCSINNYYPDVLNVDIEGAEYNAIIGAERLIDERMPIVYVSVHNDFLHMYHKKTFNDIYQFMFQFGYKVDFLGHDHETHFVFYKKSLIKQYEVL